MKLLISWVISSVAVLITSHFVSGFTIKDISTAFLLAVVLGFLNTIVKPILRFFTLPITILTLGLFTFVINALILEIAAFFVPGVSIDSFFPSAVIAALVLSIVGGVLNRLFK